MFRAAHGRRQRFSVSEANASNCESHGSSARSRSALLLVAKLLAGMVEPMANGRDGYVSVLEAVIRLIISGARRSSGTDRVTLCDLSMLVVARDNCASL
jgi:hypothetical protein